MSSKPKLIAQLGVEDGVSSKPVGITVNGNYAYVGHDSKTATQLEIINISDPYHPDIVATPTDSSGFFPAAYGDYLYCDAGTGIRKIDISNPVNPVTVGNPCSTEYNSDSYNGMTSIADGTTLYLAVLNNDTSKPSGLMTINFYDGDNPEVESVDEVTRGDPFSVIEISATEALLSVGEVGVLSFAISGDKEGILDTYEIDNMGAGFLETNGKYAYVGNLNGPLTILDVSSPSSLSHVYTYDPGEVVLMSTVSGHYLFADLNSSQSFTILDIQDPSAPVTISKENSGWICEIVGNYAYGVDNGKGKFYVYDLIPED